MPSTITGMFKVLKQNFMVTNAVTLTASTGDSTVDNIKDFDRDTKWQSVGTDDTTTETITATFTLAVTVSRLMIITMNFKDFDIQYHNGSIWVDFTTVYSESNPTTSVTGIAETANTLTTRYYEFDAVSTLKIRIQATKSLVVDAEKFLTEFYIGAEIGTFTEDITSAPNTYTPVLSNTRSVYITKSNGGTLKYVRGDKYMASVNLAEMLQTVDQTIINTMYNDGQFAILPCGGVAYTQEGWRLQDFFNVIIRGNKEAEFAIGRVATLGLNYIFDLLEQ